MVPSKSLMRAKTFFPPDCTFTLGFFSVVLFGAAAVTPGMITTEICRIIFYTWLENLTKIHSKPKLLKINSPIQRNYLYHQGSQHIMCLTSYHQYWTLCFTCFYSHIWEMQGKISRTANRKVHDNM